MKSITEYLESSTLKNGKKIAVIEEEKQIDYDTLLLKSKKIGTYLCDEILSKEPVVIFMDKGILALLSFLGTAYAGGFYSLINPDFPESRIEKIITTLNGRIVITNKDYYDLASKVFKKQKVILVEEILKTEIDNFKLEERMKQEIDTDPLYANFTSGSTGIPKGVVVGNRSVIDFIDIFTEEFGINEKDIIANQAPFDFDVSVKDIYSALKVGATLLIVPKRLFSNPSLLLDYLVDNNATTLIWAVSALCLISTFHGLDYRLPISVNKVLFSGEVMPKKHLENWMEKLPNTTFVNLFGPTEITCNCTYHVIDRNRKYESGIPIGKAFKNERVFLLDENNLEITSPNVTGEICVAGSCLALGYFNNAEQTNKHFVQNPLNPYYNEIIYRTGDLGYYDEMGDIYFQGRKDFQIKYMGHRIELEEIERAIDSVEGVERSCCVFEEEKSKLHGFYIGSISKKELHISLKQILPVYMIPSSLMQVEDFPMTKNGKRDRKKLMELKEEKK